MEYTAYILCSDRQWTNFLCDGLEGYCFKSRQSKQHYNYQRLACCYYDDCCELDFSGRGLQEKRFHTLSASKYLIIVCSEDTLNLRNYRKPPVEDKVIWECLKIFISNGKERNIVFYIVDDGFKLHPELSFIRQYAHFVYPQTIGEKASIDIIANILLGLDGADNNNMNEGRSVFRRIASHFRGEEKQIVEKHETKTVETIDEFAANKFIGVNRRYNINYSILSVKFGDIISSNAEVIVSSDDNCLTMGGGVSGAILSKAGDEVINNAKKNTPAQLGDAIVTTAGKLPQKYIFHCVTIDYSKEQQRPSDDLGMQKYIIRRSVDKCLRLMPLLGIESIAFPAIGAGVANYSLEEVALSMAEIIIEFLFTTNKKYSVELYLYDKFNSHPITDYMVFFENVAKFIDRHQKVTYTKTLEETQSSIAPSKLLFGQMAANSPDEEHKVFISYSRANIEVAQVFCKLLDEINISYWIDVNGKYSGNNFKEVLVDAIDSSQVMVFLSSKESNNSSFVIKELSLAVAGKKKILPIRLDDAPYAKSIRFDLSDIDWIDYSDENQQEALRKFNYCLQLFLKESQSL